MNLQALMHYPIPATVMDLVYHATRCDTPERAAIVGTATGWIDATESVRRMACLYVAVALAPLGWRACCALVLDPDTNSHVPALVLIAPNGARIEWRHECQVTNLAVVYQP